jgi:hypothetical protein
MKRMAVLTTFINAEIFLAEIEHHIFVFWGSTDSLSWTPTEETVLRVEKKWAGAIGIPLQRGGQLIERRWRRHRWRRRRRLREMAAESNTLMAFQHDILKWYKMLRS